MTSGAMAQQTETDQVVQAAKQLKSALASKLQAAGKQHGQGLIRAINLCERFIGSTQATSLAALDVLKQEVKKALLAPPCNLSTKRSPAGKAAAKLSRQLSGLECTRNTISKAEGAPNSGRPPATASSQASKRSSELDWTIPPQLLDARAFVKGDAFGVITKQQDKVSEQDGVKFEADRRAYQAKIRAMLDTQCAEQEIAKAAQIEAKRAEARALVELRKQISKEEEQQWHAKEQHKERQRMLYQQQADEADKRREAERQAELARAAAEKAAIAEQQRKDKEKRAQQAAAARAEMALFLAANEEGLRLKAQQAEQQKEEERRMNMEYIKMMEERERRRQQEMDDLREWQMKLFERGGGKALQAGLQEQARMDAERAQRLHAEYEAKQAVLEERKRQEAQQRLQEQLAHLELQTKMKQQRQLQEKEADKVLGDRYAAEARQVQEEVKQRKAEVKQQQAAELLERRQAMLDERRRHYKEQTSAALAESDQWVHKAVLAGQQRAFNTLKESYLPEVKKKPPKPKR